MDYLPGGVKRKEDTFVFLRGKSANEMNIESAAFSPSPEKENLQIHTAKIISSDGTLWEANKVLTQENKALREENKTLREEFKTLTKDNQTLRVENQALRKENDALQGLPMESEGIQVMYHKSPPQGPQQDTKPPEESLPNFGLLNSIDNKALHLPQGDNKPLPVLQEGNAALRIFPELVFSEKKTPTPVLRKEKLPVQLLGKEDPVVPEALRAATPQENSPNKATLSQGVKVVPEIRGESRTLPVPERTKTPVSLLEKLSLDQIPWSLLIENQILLEEKGAFLALLKENKTLRETNGKLKLQRVTDKGVVYKIVAQMNVLLQELNTFAFWLETVDGLRREESQAGRGARAEYRPFMYVCPVFSRA